jgi:hypothetical protein
MTTIIDGTTGVDKVVDGSIALADLASEVYSTGTFTMTHGGTWSSSFTSVTGKYWKIGKQVTVTILASGGAAKTGTGGWLEGLPFTPVDSFTGTVTNNAMGNKMGLAVFSNGRLFLVDDTFSISYPSNYMSVTYCIA